MPCTWNDVPQTCGYPSTYPNAPREVPESTADCSDPATSPEPIIPVVSTGSGRPARPDGVGPDGGSPPGSRQSRSVPAGPPLRGAFWCPARAEGRGQGCGDNPEGTHVHRERPDWGTSEFRFPSKRARKGRVGRPSAGALRTPSRSLTLEFACSVGSSLRFWLLPQAARPRWNSRSSHAQLGSYGPLSTFDMSGS